MAKTVTVYPERGKWVVRRDAAGTIKVFTTQKEAIEKARTLACALAPSQVVVIGRNGMIRNAITHGYPKVSDPPIKSARSRKIEKAVVRVALERLKSAERA